MATRLIIDMFSGRPNPTIELGDVGFPAFMKLSGVNRPMAEAVTADAPPSVLGYRGVILEETNTKTGAAKRSLVTEDAGAVGDLLRDTKHKTLADFLLEMKGATERKTLKQAVTTFRAFLAQTERGGKNKAPAKCACAPHYEPAWWNDGGQRQFNNNCYNYSANYRTDTFAQPGTAGGRPYATLDCAAVHAGALADDLQDTPLENQCPADGHLVALVVAPGYDYHWYRKGRDGCWTHKPGGTAVTNLDNSGNVIFDPRTADRGPYTDFCQFMAVMHGHIKLR